MKKVLNILKWTFIVSLVIGIIGVIINPKTKNETQKTEDTKKANREKYIEECITDVRYNKSNEIKTKIQNSLNDVDSYETIEEKTYLLNDTTIVYYLQYSAKNGFNATIKKEVVETFKINHE
jgi:flagellar basal body-associated protein FliL